MSDVNDVKSTRYFTLQLDNNTLAGIRREAEEAGHSFEQELEETLTFIYKGQANGKEKEKDSPTCD